MHLTKLVHLEDFTFSNNKYYWVEYIFSAALTLMAKAHTSKVPNAPPSPVFPKLRHLNIRLYPADLQRYIYSPLKVLHKLPTFPRNGWVLIAPELQGIDPQKKVRLTNYAEEFQEALLYKYVDKRTFHYETAKLTHPKTWTA